MNTALKILNEAVKAAQAVLLLVSVWLMVSPQARRPETIAFQSALLTLECIWMIYRVWRRRQLHLRSEEVQQDILLRGSVTSGVLERSSLAMGLLAAAVIAF